MAILIKLFYSLAVATFLILFVAFGIRTFYEGPEEPTGPYPVGSTWEQRHQEYEDDQADYHRNVFLVAGLLGLGAAVAGVVLPDRFDAMRLGLLMGGVGVIAYAVSQAGNYLDDMGAGPVFAVAVIGLIVLLLVGYRWLGGRLLPPLEKD